MLCAVSVGDGHLGQAVLDDVHLHDRLTLADQDRAGWKPPPLQTPQNARQLVLGQPLKK